MSAPAPVAPAPAAQATAAPATAATGKSEHAYRWLRERIAQREYAPGHRLVLQTIGDELGMSVVPVREAIRRLEAEGFVTFERNVGARVTLVDEAAYLSTMQTLAVLEGAATALAAPFVTEERWEAARALNEQIARQFGRFDPAAVASLNRRFHATLTEPCPNPVLLELADTMWTKLASVRDASCAFVEAGARASVVEHERLLELVRAGDDPLAIEQLMREHRLRASTAFLAGRRPAAAL